MASQFLINLLIAFLWMFLYDDLSFTRFAAGFGLGLLFIGLLNRFLKRDFYLRKVKAVLVLLLIFIRELFLSSFTVIYQILKPKLTIRPGIVAMETRLKSDGELTLLACLICLTPGTLTLDVADDHRTLYIHAMDIGDAEQLRQQIRSTFERAIMEVTR
ncbi:Na+/H+ antiporter subunit E [Paenibacillus pasadenensis]|uniref:Na(+) H(+) antiporter subunit E n=1 Tax=Paenibacillus pasadenensis TaxID=217090 RepID=A0A2N5N6V5_9BACL|nr:MULTISPECIES: Na+/H+ antiporter subunit E [Paenibacillus]PLT46084.1 Na(+) H(+) antiporter subunit E [Paenibacillus pasadenensis]QGG56559.1 Na+/H+ antiporter subunit E [Paenibacillus sp. B01]